MEHVPRLGGRSCSPDIAGQLLTKASKKALDIGQFAAGLSKLPVAGILLEHRAVGLPEVGEAQKSLKLLAWR
jgi:hypothetical protein